MCLAPRAFGPWKTITSGVGMARSSLPFILIAGFWLGSCSAPKPPPTHVRAQSKSGEGTLFVEDVVPVVGGSAYAVLMPYGLWYLNGSTAMPVRVIGDSATKARFSTDVLPRIQPTSDGGAYAFSVTGGVWRLDGDSVRLVVLSKPRGATSTAQEVGVDSLGFALSGHDHMRQSWAERRGGSQ